MDDDVLYSHPYDNFTEEEFNASSPSASIKTPGIKGIIVEEGEEGRTAPLKNVTFDVIGGIIGKEGEKGSNSNYAQVKGNVLNVNDISGNMVQETSNDTAMSQKTDEAISVGESEIVGVIKGAKRPRIKVTSMSKKIHRGGNGPSCK